MSGSHILHKYTRLKGPLLLAPAVLYLLVLFVLPVLKIILWSFQSKATSTLTFSNYVIALSDQVNIFVIMNTLKISLVVTGMALALGYPVAYVLARLPSKTSNVLMIFVFLPFWTSILVRAYAWTVILQSGGPINDFLLFLGIIDEPMRLVRNTLGVVIGTSHFLLPFMILPIYSAIRGIDLDLLKAAQNLGAGPIRSFTRVILPLSLPGIGAGCVLVFILAIGAFVTPALLGGLEDMFIAQLIEQQVNVLLDWNMAATLTVVLLGTTLGLLYLFGQVLSIGRIWGER